MSAEINENNKKLNREETILSQNNQELKIISKNKNNSTKYELFTKKWRVKLYILDEIGKWDDKGVGYVFCANEEEEEGNVDGGKHGSNQLIKKLIMLKEKTEEVIFNIDIIKENIDFHNQRGTILTWKKGGSYGQDNNAISFQDKEGVLEILKYIKTINGKNISEEELLKDESSEILLDITVENLPNLVREYGPNMDEQKVGDFIEYLKETNFEFVKKLGKILEKEEQKSEDAVSYSSQETDVTLNLKKENSNDSNGSICTKDLSGTGDVNKKINKQSFNKNINYIFNIFKNLILIGEKELIEILFDDECYLITFGAFEHDPQSNKLVPHRKYFKEIVKFKNPLNIRDPELLQKINQNLRLAYFRDTAFSRLIDDNTIRTINTIIQMNQGNIVQYFINNKEYLDILYSQLKSEDIVIQKDAILFLSELINCSKNVAQSRITFNEVLCENGLLPILNTLLEENPNNQQNNQDKEKINLNTIEIFINVLSSVPNLVLKFLKDNEENILHKLANILLYHTNFGVKCEVSQIFKTLIEGDEEPYDKTILYNSTIEEFVSFLISPNLEDKNDISSTIQIIIEIFIAWINNMGFDSHFWVEKFQINQVIVKLLKDNNKIVNLHTIKLLKIILENSEHSICIKILSNELCNLLINIFDKNIKKKNLLTSCLLNLFDTISQNDIYILNIIMNYTNDYFYSHKDYFKNIILRYEGKSTPKKNMISFLNLNTITETSLKDLEPIFNSNIDINNYKEDEIDEEFDFYDNNLFKGEDDDEGNDILNKSGNIFSIENNSERSDYLSKKRNMEKDEEEENDEYFNCDEIEPLDKRLNNYYKNINIFNNGKYKNKEYVGLSLKETDGDEDDDLYKNIIDIDENLF